MLIWVCGQILSCFVYYQPFIIYLERSARVTIIQLVRFPHQNKWYQKIPRKHQPCPQSVESTCSEKCILCKPYQILERGKIPRISYFLLERKCPLLSKVKWMNHDRKTQTQTPSPKNPWHSSDVNPSTVVLLHLCLQTIRQNPWKPSKGKFLEADNAASQQQRPTVLYSMNGSQLAD